MEDRILETGRMFRCLTALALMAVPLMAAAGFEEGLAAFERGDHRAALKEWRPLAQRGNADAQNNLGTMYYNGQGVAQDYVVAYALFNLSASIDSSSQNNAARNRNSIIDGMSPAQVEAGQALTRRMSGSGNVSKALDQYQSQRW